MFTKIFWKAALERAIKTFAQALIAAIGIGEVSIVEINWSYYAGVALLAAVLSVLTSLSATPKEVMVQEELDSYKAQHSIRM